MSRRASDLVRAARLPEAMRHRMAAKAVLLALADKADHLGGEAYPSLARIAAETELCIRTVRRALDALQQQKLIRETAPPQQHKPRTWGIDLAAIEALVRVDTV